MVHGQLPEKPLANASRNHCADTRLGSMSVMSEHKLAMMKQLDHSNNLERLRKIHKTIIARELRSANKTRDLQLVQRLIPFPAFLAFAGFPLHHNQRCCFHQSSPDGTSLSFFVGEKGHWMFKCNSAHCGISGDVTDFWLLLVEKVGLPHRHWSRHQAAADLLARVESGEIDVRITDFEGESAKAHGHAAGGDEYFPKLFALCKNRPFTGEAKHYPSRFE